jgi:hypothetical protein
VTRVCYSWAIPKRNLNLLPFFLIDAHGEVIYSQEAISRGNLIKDVMGNIRFQTDDSTWILEIDTNSIAYFDAVPTKTYKEKLSLFTASLNGNFYFKNFKDDDQVLEYYCYKTADSSLLGFATIINEEGLALRETRHIFERNEFEKRFSEMCIFDPIYAPMAVLDSNLYLFNYVDDKLEIYSSDNKQLAQKTINFHKEKGFYELLLLDEGKRKFYAVYRKNGIFYLAEIDTSKAIISSNIKIPEFEYIEKLQVKDGIAFFLYKKSMANSYKRLFKMRI